MYKLMKNTVCIITQVKNHIFSHKYQVPFSGKAVGLEMTVLHVTSQSHKDKYHRYSLICNICGSGGV